jgi:endoglucanase
VLTAGAKLWVDPDSSTAQVGSADARRLAAIPSATWLTGGPPRQDARRVTTAAARAGAVPVIVAYNIPGRDCGEYSAGGAGSARGYRAWIDQLARGIGDRRAAVIVEPDALAGGCTRTRDVKAAVDRLRRLERTAVYLDAGHSRWQPAATMVKRLRAAGIARADGFALNVSNYRRDDELIAYGTAIAKRVRKPFVIDTSRNGQGPAGGDAWCNPPGRGLGARPTTTTNTPRLDAKLWVKTPGESDGECERGEPAAGRWFPRQAAELIRLATPPLKEGLSLFR